MEKELEAVFKAAFSVVIYLLIACAFSSVVCGGTNSPDFPGGVFACVLCFWFLDLYLHFRAKIE